MTEAFSHTEPKPKDAEILQFPLNSEIDFSTAAPERVSAAYLHQLPSDEHGYVFAETIRSSLREDTDLNIRITELIQHVTLDDIDAKDQDMIIEKILEIIKETKGDKEMQLQRRVLITLAELRASFSKSTTEDDPVWFNVVGRLIS